MDHGQRLSGEIDLSWRLPGGLPQARKIAVSRQEARITLIQRQGGGKVDLVTFPGDTVDLNPSLSPTYVDDARTLTRVPLEHYDLALADPPYSVEDCDHYQTTMVKRNVVMRALQRLPEGAHVVWLGQVLPMYRKDMFALEASIGMQKSTNHRFRMINVFRRRGVN